MDESTKYKEAVAFFKNNRNYHRILKGMVLKYKSIGTLGGIVELNLPTYEERLILSKIDSKYINSKQVRFSINKFLNTFKNTELEGLDFLMILQKYFGEELKTNKKVKEDKLLIRNHYFSYFFNKFSGTKAINWLGAAIENKNYGYMLLIKEYENDEEKLRVLLDNVLIGINKLEKDAKEYTRLAIFASKQTMDPHFFDTYVIGGKLLLCALAYLSGSKTAMNSEEENELLYGFGLIKDEISNFTTVSSIIALTEEGAHAGIKGFYDRNEPLSINLSNLSNIKEIKCNYNKVFVFENPTVFSEVLQNTMEIKPSLICTSGQLKLASIVVLDKIKDNVDKIYYSGDFDPEGINIAYKLKQRYGDKLELWNYNVENYRKIASDVIFNDKRFKQIEEIKEPSMLELIMEMKEKKVCGYQELLVDKYIKDIVNFKLVTISNSQV